MVAKTVSKQGLSRTAVVFSSMGLMLTVVYAAHAVQQRAWEVELGHRAVLLDGRRVPGASRLLRHDYPLSTGVFRALKDARPGVVVVSGWSTYASQATIAWCRRHSVPYVLLVESNERDARPGWRRAVKGAVVPAVVGGAGVRALGAQYVLTPVLLNAAIIVTVAVAFNGLLARRRYPAYFAQSQLAPSATSQRTNAASPATW